MYSIEQNHTTSRLYSVVFSDHRKLYIQWQLIEQIYKHTNQHYIDMTTHAICL